MKRLSMLVVFVGALASMGCATVFRGQKQAMRFTSDPAGVDVKVNGHHVGQTPIDIEGDRDRQPGINLTKDGYDGSVSLKKEIDTGWAVWDIGTCVIPITLCIPLIVDGFSGAWYSYDERYEVKLATPATGVSYTPPRAGIAPTIKPSNEPGY